MKKVKEKRAVARFLGTALTAFAGTVLHFLFDLSDAHEIFHLS